MRCERQIYPTTSVSARHLFDDEVRDWMFRGLLFEAEAEKFRSAGIRVGADNSESERALLEETLDPFSIDLRNEALEMARLYALVYCFENSVRALIEERLSERHGIDWANTKVSGKIKELAASRQKDVEDNSWLEGQSKGILSFVEFGHFSDIVIANWDDFRDLVPSQHWLKQRFDELEKARNFLAHNRFLLPDEFQRVEMYINDWNRMDRIEVLGLWIERRVSARCGPPGYPIAAIQTVNSGRSARTVGYLKHLEIRDRHG